MLGTDDPTTIDTVVIEPVTAALFEVVTLAVSVVAVLLADDDNAVLLADA